MRAIVAPLLVLLGLTSCSVFGPACTLELRPGILVTLLDSATAGPIDSDSVVVVAVDGTYADSIGGRPSDDPVPRVGLAYERAGSYRVEVRAEGYKVWSRSGVRVRADDCHVRTVEVVALLQR